MISPFGIEERERINGLAAYFLLVFGYTVYKNFDFLLWILSGNGEGTFVQNLIYFPEYAVLILAALGLYLRKLFGWISAIVLSTYGISSSLIFLIQKVSESGDSSDSELFLQLDEFLGLPSYGEILLMAAINGLLAYLLLKSPIRKTFKVPKWLPIPLVLIIPILNFILYFS